MEEKKQNPYLIPGAIVVAGLVVAGAVLLTQKQAALQPSGSEALPSQEGQAPEEVKIALEGFESVGNPEASVVMVEYADFACPFCGRFWRETLPAIKRDYIDTGKVRLVYKDFIVVGGDRAAEAAHCAKEQGKFWEYHDLLFSRQSEDRAKWADAQVHRGYAKDLGLDEGALIECFEGRRYQEQVSNSSQEAIQNGGQGTPYFLINKTSVFGAQDYSEFKKVIDSLLAEQ